LFRRLTDFDAQWKFETDQTLKVLRALTDRSLAQPIVAGGRTLGFLAWHVTVALPVQMAQAGAKSAGPGHEAPLPSRASEIADAYEKAAVSLGEAVKKSFTDEKLPDMVSYFGRQMPIGMVLEAVIRHQAHHRGQMTVLMRQSGVPVPGVYGPSKEEWEAMGMPAHA
jgi:uncharacterized damage-inducible protein DinB